MLSSDARWCRPTSRRVWALAPLGAQRLQRCWFYQAHLHDCISRPPRCGFPATRGCRLRTLLTQSSWGYLWIGQVALSVIVAIMMQRAARDDSPSLWRALSVLSFALLVTPSLASHAMSAHMSRWLTLPADMLHLTGVSVWIGTLTVMFVASARISTTTATRTIAALLVPFSPLALAGAATVVASGVVSSYAHLGGFGELTRTTYGRLLLAKVALLLCVAGLGWRNWKRMTPQLDQQGSAPLRRSIVTELAFAVLVLLVTSALVITPPPMMHMSN